MTDDIERAYAYLKEHHTTENTTDFQNAMNIAVVKAYLAACEYKNEEITILKQKLSDLQSAVCDWGETEDILNP